MRYLFDTKEEQRDIGLQISRWESDGKIQMIEKGDKFEQVKKELLQIKMALDRLNKLGINQDVMRTYIYSKSKVSKTNIELVLYEQKQFLKKLGVLWNDKGIRWKN